MEEKIKQRLVGILVLIGSLFIILPFLFHNSRPSAEEQKTLVAASNAATPPAVSVTLPAENSVTSTVNAASATAATMPTTTGPANTTTAAVAPTSSSATINAPAAGSVAATTTANAPVTENVVAATTPAVSSPSISQTQPGQSAQVSAKETPAVTSAKKAVAINSAKLNSNTIASTPDASGFKPDEAVSPTSGLTTGVPISTPTTTEATPSSSDSVANQSASTTQPINEAVPKHTVAQHKQAIKTAYHPHHAVAHAMTGKKWEIQLAVFSNEHNAKRLMAKLRAHHFAAHTRRIMHHGRHMTAVFVGPEINHPKTLALRNHLRREFHLNGVVKQV